jgi:lysophospholipase L1-like esterase
MVLSHLVSRLKKDSKRIGKGSQQAYGRNRSVPRHSLEQLEDRTQPSVFTFAVMGDSLSTNYSGSRASDGDMSWVQLLRLLRSASVQIDDYAQDGATSANVANVQASQVASLVSSGSVHYSVLEVGGNDEHSYLSQISAGIYTAFVNEVVANIESALNTVQQAGQVQQILGLVPDIAFSPSVQNNLGHNPTKIANVLTATNMANQQLESYANAHGIVVIDTVGLGQLTQQASITLAGTATNDYWSPDNFHPSGVMQGLFSNAVMKGFQEGYSAATSGLIFTDQEILNNSKDAGTPTIQTATYFNVQPYVILPPNHEPPPPTHTPTVISADIYNVFSAARAVDGLGFITAASLLAT